MIIGIPKEVKDHEFRIALTPGGAESLTRAGHAVIVEHDAGLGSGFSDDEYLQAGARVLPSAEQVWAEADMILKVKQPSPSEYGYLRPGMLLFAYLHLAAAPDLAVQLLEQNVDAVAYETVQLVNGSLPLLTPMSEVAGRMVVQIGAHYLESTNGGRGVLLGGVPGVRAASVVIVGGGTVGTNAAWMAMGLGARVTVIDINLDRLRYLDEIMRGKITTMASNRHNISEAVRRAELVIGAVLVPGAKAPCLVTEEMIASMAPGSVVIDVAVDQGGCIETIYPTSHSQPTYTLHGVIHYAVPNIPGAVPRTSTYALSDATLPYVTKLADRGLAQAVRSDAALSRGLNTTGGKLTSQPVAEALGLPYTAIELALS